MTKEKSEKQKIIGEFKALPIKLGKSLLSLVCLTCTNTNKLNRKRSLPRSMHQSQASEKESKPLTIDLTPSPSSADKWLLTML